jgi:hypothetical protein
MMKTSVTEGKVSNSVGGVQSLTRCRDFRACGEQLDQKRAAFIRRPCCYCSGGPGSRK